MKKRGVSILEIPGGVTAPLGFRADGVWCGIKRSKRPDLALVFSVMPARAAGVFTSNAFKAGSVLYSQELIKSGRAQAIVLNSGNANCATGKRGVADAARAGRAAAKALGIDAEDVLVCSTGVIGKPLPIDKIERAVPGLAASLNRSAGHAAARAIMTTDTFVKEAAVRIEIGGREVRIGGMAKGAGMIAPHLATMLAVITTDAHIEPGALRRALQIAAGYSFNRISVDGDQSTNDTVLALANDLAANPRIETGQEGFRVFVEGLTRVCQELALGIVRDGEGATKLIEVSVRNAATEEAAERLARQIANSVLVKTAMYGGDPNWGRIAAAAGSAGVSFDPLKLDIWLGGKRAMRSGSWVVPEKRKLAPAISGNPVRLALDLHQGKASAIFWTCDLSPEYVKLNARYER